MFSFVYNFFSNTIINIHYIYRMKSKILVQNVKVTSNAAYRFQMTRIVVIFCVPDSFGYLGHDPGICFLEEN